MPKPYSADLRERVLLADEAAVPPAAIANVFAWGRRRCTCGVSRRRAGAACAKPYCGGRARDRCGGRGDLAGAVAERNDRTLDEYREQLAARSGGPPVSGPTLCRALRRLRLWRKKDAARERARSRRHPGGAGSLLRTGAATRRRKPGLPRRERITTAMTRLYARARRGERARLGPGRLRRLTVLGALSGEGMIVAINIQAATTTRVFLAFLQAVLIPELRRRYPGATVLMGSLPHTSQAVEPLSPKPVTLLYPPRYSLDLSPIAPGWSKLRAPCGPPRRAPRDARSCSCPALDSITLATHAAGSTIAGIVSRRMKPL